MGKFVVSFGGKGRQALEKLTNITIVLAYNPFTILMLSVNQIDGSLTSNISRGNIDGLLLKGSSGVGNSVK